MSALPKRTSRRHDRRATEKKLISAAIKLFASHGYEATTTREIASSAGCAEGLIHRYFGGKSGLLFTIIDFQVSLEMEELADNVPRCRTLEKEIQQLMTWEVDHMWKNRDLIRVSIPRAIIDPKVGKFIGKAVPQSHAKVIAERLRRHLGSRSIQKIREVEALSHSIVALGFIFGFMRPVVLRQKRQHAKSIAGTIAEILSCGVHKARPHARKKRLRGGELSVLFLGGEDKV